MKRFIIRAEKDGSLTKNIIDDIRALPSITLVDETEKMILVEGREEALKNFVAQQTGLVAVPVQESHYFKKGEKSMATEQEALDIKNKYRIQILNTPGVVSIGVQQKDSGEYHLIVGLKTEEVPEDLNSIISKIQSEENIEVVTKVTGELKALPNLSRNP